MPHPVKAQKTKLTELAQRDIEQAVRGTRRPGWAVARVLRVVLHRGKGAHVGREAVAENVVGRVHLLLEAQRQQAAQVLVVDVQRAVGRDVRGEDGAVGAVEAVALLLGPVRQVRPAVVLVDNAELGNVLDAGEDGDAVRRGGVLAVHQAKLFVGQLLLLGHHVLGQLEEWILVAPEELADRHLDEWLDL